MVPSVGFDRTGNGVRISRLIVDRVPKGAKVVAKCSGCGSQTVRAKKTGTVSLTKLVGKSVRRGREHRDPRHARRAAHRDVQVRRDRQLLQVAGAGQRARQAPDALHRRGDGVEDRDLQVRTLAVAVFAALAFAAPAQAQLAPPPTVLDFEALDDPDDEGPIDGSFYPGVTMTTPVRRLVRRGVRGARRRSTARTSRTVAVARRSAIYGGTLDLAFAAPQTTVSLFIAVDGGEGGGATASRRCRVTTVVDEADVFGTGPFGRRRDAVAGADITSVVDRPPTARTATEVTIDDLSFSPVTQPDTEILALADGRVALSGNQKVDAFECSVDGAEFSPAARPSRSRSSRSGRTRCGCG